MAANWQKGKWFKTSQCMGIKHHECPHVDTCSCHCHKPKDSTRYQNTFFRVYDIVFKDGRRGGIIMEGQVVTKATPGFEGLIGKGLGITTLEIIAEGGILQEARDVIGGHDPVDI